MIIKIKVYPHSGREEILKISDDSYKVYLKKPAEDNKANIELLKLFRRHFKVEAKIIKGFSSREKIIEVKNGNKL
jgi:uncharacterized protein (TIGR00251 family)